MSLKTIKVIKGDDFHCHLRRGDVLKSVISYTTSQFKRAVVMPNTSPPILTGQDALDYRKEIISALPTESDFEPLMTIQINDYTTSEMIEEANNAGVIAGKVYPLGVTTNSYNGVTNFQKISPIFEKMEKEGMLLLLHGESPDASLFCLEREKIFLDTLVNIVYAFPELRVVLEHVTTIDAVEVVKLLPPNIAATIAVHYLFLTLNNVIGNFIEPHNFCKPIAKRPEDRKALEQAALSGNPKFFYGGDSAPHLKEKKECAYGCAGIFNAPVALPLLVQFFEEHDAINEKLQNFISVFGANFYGLPLNNGKVELVKKDWIVPDSYNGIVPFMVGETLLWQVV